MKVTVDWPDDLTRERMMMLAEYAGRARIFSVRDALRALAAIAPEAPKKRMVNLWNLDNRVTMAFPVEWLPSDVHSPGWVKKGGPFEIEE